MNKRDLVLSLLDDSASLPTVPAAFFLHFPPEFHEGQAAVNKHIDYFRHTGMDFVKIQYERNFPHIPTIQKPADWANMPLYGLDFYAGQLKAVEGLVKALKKEAVIVLTLYSPFMCAGHTTSDDLISQHLTEDADAVKKGMEIITESKLAFVRECIKLGVDGFYMSTQGGEAGRPYDAAVFDAAIKAYELTVMNEVDAACDFNILHVCDYRLDYGDATPFLDYPGDLVSCPLNFGGGKMTMKEAADLFKRPVMGGMERKGTIVTGTPEEVKQEAETVLKDAPERFVLSADCTVLPGTPWDNIKAAVDAAHGWKQSF